MARKETKPRRWRVRVGKLPARPPKKKTQAIELIRQTRTHPEIIHRSGVPEGLMQRAPATMLAQIATRKARNNEKLNIARACADRVEERGKLSLSGAA